MEITNFILDEDDGKKKHKGGIKSFSFTASGTNGKTHRANKERKHRQYLANREVRSQLNQDRGRITAKEYHMRLDALNSGQKVA